MMLRIISRVGPKLPWKHIVCNQFVAYRSLSIIKDKDEAEADVSNRKLEFKAEINEFMELDSETKKTNFADVKKLIKHLMQSIISRDCFHRKCKSDYMDHLHDNGRCLRYHPHTEDPLDHNGVFYPGISEGFDYFREHYYTYERFLAHNEYCLWNLNEGDIDFVKELTVRIADSGIFLQEIKVDDDDYNSETIAEKTIAEGIYFDENCNLVIMQAREDGLEGTMKNKLKENKTEQQDINEDRASLIKNLLIIFRDNGRFLTGLTDLDWDPQYNSISFDDPKDLLCWFKKERDMDENFQEHNKRCLRNLDEYDLNFVRELASRVSNFHNSTANRISVEKSSSRKGRERNISSDCYTSFNEFDELVITMIVKPANDNDDDDY